MNQEQLTGTTDEFFNDIGTKRTSECYRRITLSGQERTIDPLQAGYLK
jgi:hypothetical protein